MFTSLVFELDAVSGGEPSEAVRNRVRSETELLVRKPAGVSVVLDQNLAPRGADYAWTGDELSKLAAETRNLELGDQQARVHVLVVDGHADSDSDALRTLGTSFSNHTIVLFQQTIHATCSTGLLKNTSVSQFCDESVTLIWLHELGHLLGLVNAGLAMQEDHEDPEHPKHDKNPECIMYWLFHRSDAVDKLRARVNEGIREPIGFDRQCLADLAALRNAP